MKNAKRIPGYPDYAVTTTGEVITYKSGNAKTLKAATASNGYKSVVLCNKDDGKTFSVHRLVAITYCKNPKPRKFNIVNHKNGNKQDNRASNLEWTDHRGNSKHAATTITPKLRAKKTQDALTVLKGIQGQVTDSQFRSIFNILVK